MLGQGNYFVVRGAKVKIINLRVSTGSTTLGPADDFIGSDEIRLRNIQIFGLNWLNHAWTS